MISAFNEENVIEQRIRNIAEQNFDLQRLEVLIGSDGSTDNTNDLIYNLQTEYKWIKVFIYNLRRGKANVINDLVTEAKNDILVFTDANTTFDEGAISELVNGFSDSSIGGISGRLILVDKRESLKRGIEERNYWEYESYIKKSEGRCGTLICANGGLYAVRRELFNKMPTDKAVTDDLFITLSIISQNKKFMYQTSAKGYEGVAPDIKSEFQRKIRFAATNFQTLSYFKSLMFSRKILSSFAFWSHKIIRWYVPLILIFIFTLNILLFNHSNAFEILFFIQIMFYTVAFIGFIFSLLKIKQRLFSIIFYFVLTNAALFIGLVKYLQGKHSATWESTPR